MTCRRQQNPNWNPLVAILCILGWSLTVVSCDSLEESPEGEISVSASPSSIPADGISSTQINVKINSDATTRGVTLTTTQGNFLDSTGQSVQSVVVEVGNDGRGSVPLFSGVQTEVASVHASIKGLNDETTIEFVPNLPSSITLTAASSILGADSISNTTITAVLQADVGTVSQETEVFFTAFNKNQASQSVGRIASSVLSDATGTATNTLFGSGFVGTALVQAWVWAGGTQVLLTSIEVDFVSSTSTLTDSSSLTLAATPNSVVADGISSTALSAQINADATNRSVQFTTTQGTFPDGTTSFTTTANNAGEASTLLITGTQSGTAIVTATANNLSEHMTLNFTRSDPDSIILTPSTASVTADGTSSVAVLASLQRTTGSVSESIPVSFSAVHQGTTTTAGTITEQVISSGGSAQTTLFSDTTVGTVVVTASVLKTDGTTLSKTTTVSFTASDANSNPEDLKGVQALTSTESSLVADGQSTVTLAATISVEASSRVVTFVTTLGTFAQDSSGATSVEASADSTGTASTVLQSGTVTGTGVVTATFNGISKFTNLTFTRSDPDEILLTVSARTITANGTTSLTATATLAKSTGSPSQNIPVSFSAAHTSGASAGTIVDKVFSDSSGAAAATLFSDTTSGNVTITASVTKLDGTNLSKSTTVVFQ